jgi:hypothetical protein
MRRELAERHARLTRLWHAARNAYRRLNDAPVQNLTAMRAAAQRPDQLSRGRAALLSDLKALSDCPQARLAPRPRSTRAGSMMSARKSANTPSTVRPSSRNGSSTSHTSG